MSLATQLSNLATRIGTEFKAVRTSVGSLTSLSTTNKTSLVAAINEVAATVASGGTILADAITDATTIGKNVLRATDAAAARTAIGAGTSNLAIGTTASTAKAGNYTPAWADVTGKPTVIAAGADAAAARTAIGAGTSSLTIGTTASTAKAGNYVPTWTEVSAKPAVIAAGATAVAARSAIEVSSTAEMNNAISTAVNNLIDGAPVAFDTLKEISDYLATNDTAVGGLTAALANRVRVDAAQSFTEPEKLQGRNNLDVYSKTEIGNPETNLVSVFEAALV